MTGKELEALLEKQKELEKIAKKLQLENAKLASKNQQFISKNKTLSSQNKKLQAKTEILKASQAKQQKEHDRYKQKSEAVKIGLEKANIELQEKLKNREEELEKLRRKLFGRSSEKMHHDYSGSLLLPIIRDEFKSQEPDEPEITEDEIDESTEVKAHKRKKRKTKLGDNLSTQIVKVKIPVEKRKCPTCSVPMEVIGEVTSEKLQVIPKIIQKIIYVREKYGCKNPGCCCDSDGSQVKTAPAPPSILPKCKADESTLSYIISQKFVNAMPLYRISQDLKRYGVEIHRSTMARWVIKLALACRGIYNILKDEIREGPLIHMDETPLQVLHEKGRTSKQKSYMWVMCGTTPGKEAVVYHYSPYRKAEVAKQLLDDYSGYVMSDDYSSYDFLDTSGKNGKNKPERHLKCWAHARRNFFDILTSMKKTEGKKVKYEELDIGNNAAKFIKMIQTFYRLKKKLAATTGTDREKIKEKIKYKFEEYKKLLEYIDKRTPKNNSLGAAVRYSLNNLPGLEAALFYDDKVMDNNHAENLIRPFVIGRKNWLFCDTEAGAEATGILYSLSRTAMMHGLNPFYYFHYLFKKLPVSKKEEEIEKLFPWNLTTEEIKPKPQEKTTIITI